MKKSLILATSAIMLFFTACQETEEGDLLDPTVTASAIKAEEAFPGEAGTLEKGNLWGKPIQYANINQKAVFQGDIILTKEQLSGTKDSGSHENGRMEGTGRSSEFVRWPDNTVYFAIDPDLPDQYRVYEAIDHWESRTDIRFIQRTTQDNYITFTDDGGCYSYVGMIGGNQWISIGLGCTTGSTIHEIGHALGLWHEQSRADRDDFVLIHTSNIDPEYLHAFQTYHEQGFDGFDHDSFDFYSIMMYHPYSFSLNGLPTITRLDGSDYPFQRHELSPGDLAIIEFMYPAGPAVPEIMDIEQLIGKFDEYVSVTNIIGSGPGKSSTNRLKAFRNMLFNAKRLIDGNDFDKAWRQLTNAQKRIHLTGSVHPSHFVTGPMAQDLYNMLETLKNEI